MPETPLPQQSRPPNQQNCEVYTPAFTEWFGDSKVVDAAGKPLVVYHGTGAQITKFRTDREGQFGKGAYFSNRPELASRYAAAGAAPSVFPSYLSLQKPYTIADVEDAPARAVLERQGYDGIIHTETGNDGVEYVEYVAFRPEQIKSSISCSVKADATRTNVTRKMPRRP